jgi:hypothetical protein
LVVPSFHSEGEIQNVLAGVESFELCRRDVAEALVEAVVVEPGDVGDDR